MATRRFYWLKLSEGFFNRNDIKYLEKQENGAILVLLYIKLMLLGINDGGALYFKGNIPFNKNTLAMVTETDASTVEEALGVYAELGMIEMTDGSVIQLCDYEDLVGSESDAAARMRKHRASKEDESVTLLRKNEHSYRETEQDTEKEKETDIDREEEKSSSDPLAHAEKGAEPTFEEVEQYGKERGNLVDAEKFYDHYSAIGWMMGSHPIRDWKAAFRKWEKTERSNTANPQPTYAGAQSHTGSFDEDDFFNAALQRSYADYYDTDCSQW